MPREPAYALDVTTAGRVRWQVRLGPPVTGLPADLQAGLQVSPLAVGAVAVFAHVVSPQAGDVLYGLRLADGHRLWSRVSSQPIAGMWRWQDLVVVLTQPSRRSGLALLTGLDVSTGQARWTLRIAGSTDGEFPRTADGGLDGFSRTAEGGLAILTGDVLEVVDLSSGRVRWTRTVRSPTFYPLPMVVAGGAVLVAGTGRLTSYDDRTGQVRWVIRVGADIAALGPRAVGGLVYVTEGQRDAGGQLTAVLLAISAADGRVKWRFAPSKPGSLDAYAAGLVSVTSSSGTTTWQDELDPATGRVRWQVASTFDAVATPAGIVTGSDSSQISLRDTLTGRTRWTAGLTSGWPASFPALPVLPAGPLLIVPAAAPDGSDLLTALRMPNGDLAWQVSIPAPVAALPSAVPGGVLVYTAHPLVLP